MHRRIGGRDLFAVYNVGRGATCRFRAWGAAELWDPWTGGKRPLRVAAVTDAGTEVVMPLERTDMQLILFDPSRDAEVGAESAGAGHAADRPRRGVGFPAGTLAGQPFRRLPVAGDGRKDQCLYL